MILLGTLDDGGVFSDVYKDIYHAELQFKVEHSGNQATLLNLDITVKNGVFVYKPFLSFTHLTLIVISPNQYFIQLLLVNFLE